MTVNPYACPAIAAAQPPAPDPMQIQSTVEDHVFACIRLTSFPSTRGQVAHHSRCAVMVYSNPAGADNSLEEHARIPSKPYQKRHAKASYMELLRNVHRNANALSA
jgi:hypothetical protein